ncbi:MAG: hypothetical protein ACLQUT_10670 [Thermoleophilia bacterium]
MINLANTGAGIPDGGLFLASQCDKENAAGPLPVRGAIEVKSPSDSALIVAHGEQARFPGTSSERRRWAQTVAILTSSLTLDLYPSVRTYFPMKSGYNFITAPRRPGYYRATTRTGGVFLSASARCSDVISNPTRRVT